MQGQRSEVQGAIPLPGPCHPNLQPPGPVIFGLESFHTLALVNEASILPKLLSFVDNTNRHFFALSCVAFGVI